MEKDIRNVSILFLRFRPLFAQILLKTGEMWWIFIDFARFRLILERKLAKSDYF